MQTLSRREFGIATAAIATAARPDVGKIKGPKGYAARVKYTRERNGWTEEEAAEICAIPLTDWLSFEAGEQDLPFLNGIRFTQAAGITLEWLLIGDAS